MSGGVHIVYRKSPETYSYRAVSSDLTVPTAALASYPYPNDASYNTVPEFFHVFYSGSYTVDVGVAYENNGYYRLFANVNGTWKSGPLAQATGTKTLKSWLTAEGTKRYIITQFGSIQHKVELTTAMYNSLNGGCKIFREMVIASNSNATIPVAAYYKNATFSNTTLTKTDGTYFALHNNCPVTYNKRDSNVSLATWNTYCESAHSESGTTFVADTSSATFDKNAHPLSSL